VTLAPGEETPAGEWQVTRYTDLDQVNHAANPLDSEEWLTKAEAGELLKLHPKTIERAVGRGDIRGYKLQGRIRIRRADLDTWIEANQVEPSVHDI
jgi:excisionase family DNA binding protein